MNAATILQLTLETYTTCTSYSDSGHVEISSTETQVQLEFKTHFLRPSFLRFDWQDYGPNRGKSEFLSTLWCENGKCIMRRVSSSINEEEISSIQHALAGATGCSAGAAQCIIPLLLDQRPEHFLRVCHAQLIEENDDSYFLESSDPETGNLKIWIDKFNFSINKIEKCKSMTGPELKSAFEDYKNREERMALQLGRPSLVTAIEASLFTDKAFTTRYIYETAKFNELIDVKALKYPKTL